MHIHTTFSDGIHTPEEVVDLAIDKNIDLIAITDHDSIDGVDRAIEHSKGKNIGVISGIEISCIHSGEEVHILGYFINYKDSGLIDLTNKLKKSRYERAREIIKKLQLLGLEISLEEVVNSSVEGSIGRPAIARIMVEKGYVKDLAEAFAKYLGNDGPAYVEKYKIEVKEAIDFIHKVKGIAVLAHPGDLSNNNFLRVIEHDFEGIECIHPKHDKKLSEYFMAIAREKDLIITAGSDFHGENLPGRDGIGEYTIEIDDLSYFNRGE